MIKKVWQWIWARKRWSLAGGVILVLGALIWWKIWGAKPESTDFLSVDHIVESGSVSNSLSLAGTTKFANAQKLTFVEKGKITKVNVKVGDKVKKDQVLASISTDDLDQKVEKARRTLSTAQKKFKTYLQTKDKGLDVMRAQAEYDKLLLEQSLMPQQEQISLENAQQSLKDKQLAVKDAELKLKEQQEDFDSLYGSGKGQNADLAISNALLERNNEFEALVREYRSGAELLKSLLHGYDDFMNETDDFYDPAEYNQFYIGANNTTLLLQSKNQFYALREDLKVLENIYTTYNAIPVENLTKEMILSGHQIFKSLGEKVTLWGQTNYKMIKESQLHDRLTNADVSKHAATYGTEYEDKGYQFKQMYTQAISKLKKISRSNSDQENAQNELEKSKNNLAMLKLEYQKAQTSLDSTKTEQKLKSVELAQQVQKAKMALDDLLGGEDTSEFDEYKHAVENAQDDLTSLLDQYKNYQITANFDGLVTKVEMQVGDSVSMNNTSSDTEKYIYVETPDLLEVTLDVDQVDIVKISLNMPVEVMLDAFPDAVFSGVISEIDTMSETSSYKAKVVFQKQSDDQKILGGMSASVKVVLEEAIDVVIVPSPAIADNEAGEKIVKLKKGDQWIDQVVEVGLSDDANTQIVAGLQVGDTIKGLYINEISMQNAGVAALDDQDSFGGPRM